MSSVFELLMLWLLLAATVAMVVLSARARRLEQEEGLAVVAEAVDRRERRVARPWRCSSLAATASAALPAHGAATSTSAAAPSRPIPLAAAKQKGAREAQGRALRRDRPGQCEIAKLSPRRRSRRPSRKPRRAVVRLRRRPAGSLPGPDPGDAGHGRARRSRRPDDAVPARVVRRRARDADEENSRRSPSSTVWPTSLSSASSARGCEARRAGRGRAAREVRPARLGVPEELLLRPGRGDRDDRSSRSARQLLETAVRDLETLLEQAPNRGEAVYLLAMAHGLLGDGRQVARRHSRRPASLSRKRAFQAAASPTTRASACSGWPRKLSARATPRRRRGSSTRSRSAACWSTRSRSRS